MRKNRRFFLHSRLVANLPTSHHTSRATSELWGTVTLNGVPVPGVTVGVESNESPGLRALFRFRNAEKTKADGRYELRVKAGEHPIGALHEERGLGASAVAVRVPDGATVTHHIELEPRGTIRGSVLDADGHPIPSARVLLNEAILPADLDASGQFRMNSLDFGEHALVVELQHGDRWDDKAITRNVTLSPESPIATVNVVFQVSAQRLGGIVHYDDGTPIAGASVDVGRINSSLTDAAGRFELAVHCGNDCSVVARTAFGEAKREAFTKDTRYLDIEIPRSGSIVGTVSARDGTVVKATLDDGSDRARMSRMMGGSYKASVRNDQFAFPSIPPGHYALEASIDQKIATASANVRPNKVTRVAMGEQDGTLIFGRAIHHADGSPVAEASCGVNIMRGAKTDSAGEFQLKAMRAPDKVLVICMHDNRFGSSIVELVPATAAEVEIQLIDDPGDLGAELEPSEDGVTLKAITADGPADVAGLRQGDRIVAFDGLSVDAATLLGVVLYFETRPPHSTLTLRIRRDGAEKLVPVKLGDARPSQFK